MVKLNGVKDFAMIFLLIMTAVFTGQSFINNLEIKDLQGEVKDLQHGQLNISGNQSINRGIILETLENISGACMTPDMKEKIFDNNK